MPNQLYHRLSITEVGLAKGYLFANNIPPPTTVEYRDYSIRAPQSDGGEARHGHREVTILWDSLSTRQAGSLRTILDGVTTNLYASFDRSNGEAIGADWIDAYGKLVMPDFAASGPIATANGKVLRNVSLTIRNLTILNVPASF